MKTSENGQILLDVQNEDLNPDGSFEVPQGIVYIETKAFINCTRLKSLNISPNVIRIGHLALHDKRNLRTANFSSELMWIGDYSFNNCSSLIRINLPQRLLNIGDYAFSNCASMLVASIPRMVTNIGTGAFKDCRNLQSIVIPPLVTHINHAVFMNCISLKTIIIPSSITHINPTAFKNCVNLQSIVIDCPDGLIRQHIIELLPYALRSKVVPTEFVEAAYNIREEQLAKLAKTSETNPLYRFFNQNSGYNTKISPENGAATGGIKLPNNIFEAMNPFAITDSLYYQKAKERMLAVPYPIGLDALETYKNEIESIVNDCAARAKDFNSHGSEEAESEVINVPTWRNSCQLM